MIDRLELETMSDKELLELLILPEPVKDLKTGAELYKYQKKIGQEITPIERLEIIDFISRGIY